MNPENRVEEIFREKDRKLDNLIRQLGIDEFQTRHENVKKERDRAKETCEEFAFIFRRMLQIVIDDDTEIVTNIKIKDGDLVHKRTGEVSVFTLLDKNYIYQNINSSCKEKYEDSVSRVLDEMDEKELGVSLSMLKNKFFVKTVQGKDCSACLYKPNLEKGKFKFETEGTDSDYVHLGAREYPEVKYLIKYRDSIDKAIREARLDIRNSRRDIQDIISIIEEEFSKEMIVREI